MILQIFSACVSDSEPPNTVKSCEKTHTILPCIVPVPVITPSPKGRCLSMPKFVDRCLTNISFSSNEPGSNRISSLSLAVNLPFLCCSAILFSPPPNIASRRRASNNCILSNMYFLFKSISICNMRLLGQLSMIGYMVFIL